MDMVIGVLSLFCLLNLFWLRNLGNWILSLSVGILNMILAVILILFGQ